MKDAQLPESRPVQSSLRTFRDPVQYNDLVPPARVTVRAGGVCLAVWTATRTCTTPTRESSLHAIHGQCDDSNQANQVRVHGSCACVASIEYGARAAEGQQNNGMRRADV